ncbi:radical SAM protein [Dysgonomonas sp. 511]|uniref:radical SAM protein n=1 Tax=Dysgonomonas sp. 511 TaxID=2302930 RepID=UPI0013D0223F|nr:radical SAM protein [Dysgonomonas sp. 511]NDV77879.1 radical SAM protein [Dysgonomonas sp. 511]
MAKIGLIDVDGHNFPNLALMKIASFHKQQGDHVEWCNFLERYDKVYKSKVFTFSQDETTCIQADEIISGGTGYNKYDELFCDSVDLDYSIYPKFKESYGFLTRGCIRKCSWCVVPKKEGWIKPYRDIEEILQGRKKAVLMDNNILASDYGLEQIEKIIKLKCRVDFNQGLDSRLVTDDIAKMLSSVKWINSIRFACDTISAVDPLIKAIEKLNKHGLKNYKIFVYVLVKDINDAYTRVLKLKELGVSPFAQPYRDFENNIQPTQIQKDFARWVNHKAIFKSIDWEDYRK